MGEQPDRIGSGLVTRCVILDEFALGQREAIDDWLKGTSPVLVVEADPEMQTIAAKIIAGFADDEPSRAFVGFEGSFVDPTAFYEQAAAAIEEDLGAPAEEYERIDIKPFEFASMPRTDRRSVETRFASFLEAAAAEVEPLAEQLVVTLSFVDADNDELIRHSVTALAAAIGTPAVRIIVFDKRGTQRLRGIEVERKRVATRAYIPMKTDLAELVTDAETAGTRVVILPVKPHQRDALRRGVAMLGDPHLRLEGRFGRAYKFWDEALAKLLEFQGRDRIDYALDGLDPGGPEDLSSMAPHELRFVKESQRGAGDRFVVLIDPAVDKPNQYRRTVERLARLAFPMAVTYLVIDDAREPALEGVRGTPAVVTNHEIHLPIEQIEKNIEARLEDAELPVLERIQLLQMVASFAGARGESQVALEKGTESVDLAEEHGAPADAAMAWLALGNSLYEAKAYEPARVAYLQSAELAIDNDVDAMTGEALINVGHAHFMQEQYTEAIECYAAGRDYYRTLQDIPGECYALIWIAESHRNMNAWREADKHFDDAFRRYDDVPAYRAHGTDEGRAEVLARRARLYEAAGRRSEAERMRDNAVKLGGESNPSLVP